MMTHSSVRDAVLDALAELTKGTLQNIQDDDDLVADLGIDSMLAANLLVAIEERLGTVLPDGCEGRLVGAQTVGALVEQIVFALAADASDSAPSSSDQSE